MMATFKESYIKRIIFESENQAEIFHEAAKWLDANPSIDIIDCGYYWNTEVEKNGLSIYYRE